MGSKDQSLQEFLEWLNQKATSVEIKYTSEDANEIQDNYDFYVSLDNSLSRVIYLNFELNFNLYLYLNLNRNLNRNLYLYLNLYLNRNRNLYLYLNRNLELAKEYDLKLYQALLKLQKRLPEEENTNEAEFKTWWQENGKTWSTDYRNTIIKHQNIGHDWQFSKQQKALLEQYYLANQLLTQCLHQDCYISPEVRQEIEETLLLPLAEIKKFDCYPPYHKGIT